MKEKETTNVIDSEEESAESAPTKESESEIESTDGVKVPEAFQQKCHALISSCNDMDCLDYLSSQVSSKRTELYKKESKDKKTSTPDEYNMSDAPSM